LAIGLTKTILISKVFPSPFKARPQFCCLGQPYEAKKRRHPQDGVFFGFVYLLSFTVTWVGPGAYPAGIAQALGHGRGEDKVFGGDGPKGGAKGFF
jgi:hypothetical protein